MFNIKLTEEEREELGGRLLSMVSRKFLISILILIISSVMVARGDISADLWLKIAAGDILGYQFSNAFSKGRK